MSLLADYQKPKLLLLKEVLEKGDYPPPTVQVLVSEYHADVMRHALECLPELRELFNHRPEGERS